MMDSIRAVSFRSFAMRGSAVWGSSRSCSSFGSREARFIRSFYTTGLPAQIAARFIVASMPARMPVADRPGVEGPLRRWCVGSPSEEPCGSAAGHARWRMRRCAGRVGLASMARRAGVDAGLGVGYYLDDVVYINADLAPAGVADVDKLSNRLLKVALEEVAHYVTGATDNSRDFQDFLLNLSVKLSRANSTVPTELCV